jgi:ubiquinone/menaquinone biosynthesis C-methylase UbiE
MNDSFDFKKEKKLLLNFSTTEDRATLLNSPDFEEEEEKEQDNSNTLLSLKEKYINKKGSKKKLQVKNGHVVVHIAGYPGDQSIHISDLIHCIPFAKLKVAAKKFLKRSGVKRKRKRKKKLKTRFQHFNNGQRTEKEKIVNDDG